ncbi:MAG: serine--tRNA ligase [Candidatus Sumerlaeota bacterium]|nr:serine--tRNA ligase [Candidatus Sumerlaeota bacterium]
MLDLNFIRKNADVVKRAIAMKHDLVDVDRILALDKERRDLLHGVEQLKAERNQKSKSIGAAIKAGGDVEALKAEVRDLGDKIQSMEDRLRAIGEELDPLLMRVPNIPHESVPTGDEEANRVERGWGEPKTFGFAPKPHWEIGEALDILDLPRAVKIAGQSFICLKGLGAKLERALINFMIDMHVEKHGYTEVHVPFLANRNTMTGTGQLPKLENDMYRVESDDLFLVPTAEPPVTNLHREEIIAPGVLPIYYVAYTPCFRREAGSYGKETRGMTRVHQFDKVEMVRVVDPETSWAELESLVGNAEDVLRALGLPYRVVTLAAGDLSFAASKCYDLEVWAPGMQAWLEVSSCSNFTDFQARRMNMRYRKDPKAKPEFTHTLNGSGLALPRTVIGLWENHQQADGTVVVPECLRPYMGVERIARK